MKKNNLRPLADRVLVEIPKRKDTATISKGGIHVPDTAKGRENHGVVVATGRGVIDPKGRLHEPEVKRGDRVIFNAYAIEHIVGQDIVAANPHAKPGDRFIIRESDIIGVIE
jgi:chaperonin GroES